MTGELPLALSARSVSKTFAGTRALNSVDLEVLPGQIHALLGENGSGKSTFIKILSGYHKPDEGARVTVGGQALGFGDPSSSFALGCRFVHQDLGLVLETSVLDNLFYSAGFPTRFGTIRSRELKARTRAALDPLGLDIDPYTNVADLSAAERTGLAAARALLTDEDHPVRLLVMDEPTATLPAEEVDRLLDLVRAVASQGVGVLYVSHRIDEIFRFADVVTVLRDGSLKATRAVKDLNHRELVELLVGSEFRDASHEREELGDTEVSYAEPVLRITGISAPGVHSFDAEFRPGTVTGIAGLTGSGRDTLLPAVFGAIHRESGTVTVAGKDVPADRPDRATRLGLAYLPPDRKVSGGFLDFDGRENLTISRLRKLTRFSWIRRRLEDAESGSWFSRLQVAPGNAAHLPFASLSGGNQQKVLFGKWLRLEPLAFLLDEPTQGVDIGAKAKLHHELISAAAAGAAIVVSSTDVEELAAICQRVLVIRDGQLVAELVGSQISVQAISTESMGHGSEVVA